MQTAVSSGINTKEFKKFLSVQKNLTDQTVGSHIIRDDVFLEKMALMEKFNKKNVLSRKEPSTNRKG